MAEVGALSQRAGLPRAVARYGRGRHTLWTGDPGTALYLQGCLTATGSFPTFDRL